MCHAAVTIQTGIRISNILYMVPEFLEKGALEKRQEHIFLLEQDLFRAWGLPSCQNTIIRIQHTVSRNKKMLNKNQIIAASPLKATQSTDTKALIKTHPNVPVCSPSHRHETLWPCADRRIRVRHSSQNAPANGIQKNRPDHGVQYNVQPSNICNPNAKISDLGNDVIAIDVFGFAGKQI